MKHLKYFRHFVLCVFVFLGGCASYTTPGGPVDLTGIQSGDIHELMSRESVAEFPALLSFVRVQSPNYKSQTAATYGSGAFTIVTTREFVLDSQVEEVSNWPDVRGVAPLNRLLMPRFLNSIEDLRVAAAKLKTDILIVYTIDTSFRVDGKSIGPLSVISLGTLRDRETVVTSTASAIFVDVRTGFIYGAAESTASETKQTSAWGSGSAVDQSRLVTEQDAFSGLFKDLARNWQGIVAEHVANST